MKQLSVNKLILITSFIFVFFSMPSYGQKGGFDFRASFEFGTTPNKVTITNKETSQKISISNSLTNNFKAKAGAMFAGFNFVYIYYEIRTGGVSSVSTTKFGDTTVNSFAYNVSGWGAGAGYTGYFGKINKGAINFFGGADYGTLKLTNYYRGATLFNDIHKDASFTVLNPFVGLDWFTGNSEFYGKLNLFIAGESKDTKLDGVKSTEEYDQKQNISGIGFAFGVSHIF